MRYLLIIAYNSILNLEIVTFDVPESTFAASFFSELYFKMDISMNQLMTEHFYGTQKLDICQHKSSFFLRIMLQHEGYSLETNWWPGGSLPTTMSFFISLWWKVFVRNWQHFSLFYMNAFYFLRYKVVKPSSW